MWKLQVHNVGLYVSLLAASVFLVIAALGPGLFHEQSFYFNSWQYHIFEVLCHQDPARSYSIGGVPMAVCARCFGIYGLFLMGWLSLPVYAWLKADSRNPEKNWLIAAILLNLADVTGNYFGIWMNSLSSRLVLGGLLGISVALLLANEFFNLNKSE